MKIFFRILIIRAICGLFFLLFFPFFCGAGAPAGSFEQDSVTIRDFNLKGREAQALGDFDQALSFYTRSIALTGKIYGKDHPNLFLPLINAGIVYKNRGDYQRAIDTYRQAEALLRKRDEGDPRLGYVYTNLGTVYKIQGDYVRYRELQQAALRSFLKDSASYQSQIDIVRMNVAESLFLLKKYDEVIVNCRRGIRKVKDEVKWHYTSLLARAYEQKGDADVAEGYYHQTFAILERLEGSDSYRLGLEYANYVYFLLASNRLDQVPRYNELAGSIIVRYYTEKSTQYSEVMLNQADYFFSRGSEASSLGDFSQKRRADLNEALKYYQRSIISGTTTFSETDPFSNPGTDQAVSEIQLLQVMKKKSACLQVLGDLDLSDQREKEALAGYRAALDAMRLSADLIHVIRTGYVAEDSRLILSESEESVFSGAVNICYKLYERTGDVSYAHEAFQFAERGKSAAFLAAVTDSRAKEFGNIPDSLLTKEQVLKLNISNYREMLFEENQEEKPDTGRLTLYKEKLFQYSEKYAQLVKYLESDFPDYHAFKYKTEVTDVASIRKKLDGREALVEYLMEGPDQEGKKGKLFRFVITANEFLFTRTMIDPGFVRDINQEYGFLTDPSYYYTGLNEYRRYGSSAFRLQDHLLGDVRNALKGKRLIVIPDGQLSYIPFDALLSSPPDTSTMNFRGLAYLVKDYAVSYTYSATLLYSYYSKAKEAGKDLLAFAPGYLNDDRDDN
ncbi:MAG: tetratricopeptide repeat protein, partial [Mangrovibacterium sp.]|nr:tetratricopeptide repeat protein [Mangrovibacterium sp.]